MKWMLFEIFLQHIKKIKHTWEQRENERPTFVPVSPPQPAALRPFGGTAGAAPPVPSAGLVPGSWAPLRTGRMAAWPATLPPCTASLSSPPEPLCSGGLASLTWCATLPTEPLSTVKASEEQDPHPPLLKHTQTYTHSPVQAWRCMHCSGCRDTQSREGSEDSDCGNVEMCCIQGHADYLQFMTCVLQNRHYGSPTASTSSVRHMRCVS